MDYESATVVTEIMAVASKLWGDTHVEEYNVLISFPLISSFLIALLCILVGVKGSFKEITCSLLYCLSSMSVLTFFSEPLAVIGLEVMSLAAAFLIAMGSREGRGTAFLVYTCVHFFSGTLLLLGMCGHDNGGRDDLYACFILVGLLINAAAFPASFWVLCSYPRASSFGMMVLSLFTTKVALYLLVMGSMGRHSGEPVLTYVGAFTAVYAVIFSFMEKNIRKLMFYGLIGQIGLALIAIGCSVNYHSIIVQMSFSVVYQLLLLMVADYAERSSGSSDINKMAGSIRLFSVEALGCVIALLNLGAFPGTAGFAAKASMVSSKGGIFIEYVYPALGLALFVCVGMKFFWQTALKSGSVPCKSVGSIRFRASILALSLVLVVSGFFSSGILYSSEFVYTFEKVANTLVVLALVLFCFVLFRRQFIGRDTFVLVEEWVSKRLSLVSEKLGHYFSVTKGVIGSYALRENTWGIELGDSKDNTLLSNTPTGMVSSTLLLVMLCICIVLVWTYV